MSDRTHLAPPPRNPRPRSWTDRLLSVAGVLVLLFLFAPIVVVVVYASVMSRLEAQEARDGAGEAGDA